MQDSVIAKEYNCTKLADKVAFRIYQALGHGEIVCKDLIVVIRMKPWRSPLVQTGGEACRSNIDYEDLLMMSYSMCETLQYTSMWAK